MALLRHRDAGGVNLGSLSRQLGAFAAGLPFPATNSAQAPAEALKAYEGVYTQGDTSRQVRVVNGQLMSQRSGAQPLALLGDYSGGPLTVKVFVDDRGHLRAQGRGPTRGDARGHRPARAVPGGGGCDAQPCARRWPG